MRFFQNLNAYFFSSIFFLAIPLLSCNENGSSDDKVVEKGISMKVNDVKWESMVGTYSMNFPEPDDEAKDFIRVNLVGNNVDINNDASGNSQGLLMTFVIPKSKFNNPKGTYTIYSERTQLPIQECAVALYSESKDDKTITYSSTNEAGKAIGIAHITHFKIGKLPAWMDQSQEGYTELGGTFEMTLYGGTITSGTDVGGPEKATIKEGQFNLTLGGSIPGM